MEDDDFISISICIMYKCLKYARNILGYIYRINILYVMKNI